MSLPTPADLRSAADVLEHEWAGAHHDDRLGWNDEGIGTPCRNYVAAMRAEADRLEAQR